VTHGWVTAGSFAEHHGVSPIAYCAEKYGPIRPLGVPMVSALTMFPNPYPGRCTFMGLLPCGNGGMTIHLNVAEVVRDVQGGEGNFDPVEDATRGSPGEGVHSPLLFSHMAHVRRHLTVGGVYAGRFMVFCGPLTRYPDVAGSPSDGGGVAF
jgi:hypothetical protein